MKKEVKIKWIAVVYFFSGKDDEEWLVLENNENENEHMVIRGESLRNKNGEY